MSVSLDLIRRLTDQGALSIPAEVAGCLLLAAAEQCLEGRRVSARTLLLESSGAVTANLDFDSDSSLGALKECLAALIGDAPDGRRLREGMVAADVSELVAALRSALVPLNRPAARRSLVRLHRQIQQLGVELLETPPPVDLEPAPLAPPDLVLLPASADPTVLPAPADSSVTFAASDVLGLPASVDLAALSDPADPSVTPQLVAPTPAVPSTLLRPAEPPASLLLEGPALPPAELATPVLVAQLSRPMPSEPWLAGPLEPLERTQPLELRGDAVAAPTLTPEVVGRCEVAPPPSVEVHETPVFTRPVPCAEVEPGTPWEAVSHVEAETPWEEFSYFDPIAARSDETISGPSDPAEPTLLLGTLRVGPHERARIQLAPASPTDDETRRIFAEAFSEGLECEADDEWTFPVPVDDEATSIEPAVELDREPGLGRVTPRRSDVRELLSMFHVTPASDEEQLLSALRRSVESHGTPLPPSVSNEALRAHKR